MNNETIMLKDLSPGDEFKRFSGEHRYVVSSQREEHCGNVVVFCYNLTSGNAYDWAGGTRVVPLRRSKGGYTVMGEDCKEVIRIPMRFERGERYQVEIQGSEVVISRKVEKPEWVDITKSCYLEFRDSCHCNGRYIAVMHKANIGRPVAIIGMAGIHAQHGFKVEKPTGAYTSFRILKKNK